MMTEDFVIALHNVSFCYPGSERKALHQVTLTINAGDFIAVIGSNGSGKSTLCKAMNGLIPHFYSGDFDGEINVCSLNPLQSTVSEMSKHVGYVYQDFENQLVRPTVMEELIFARMNYGYGDYREKAFEIMALLGLTSIQHKYIWQLSGGQKHMVALAAAIVMEPSILIVDEPAAQLDPVNAYHIYEALKTMNEKFGTTIIVIEHHTEFIAEYCKHAILMDQGALVWKKETSDALNEVEVLLAQNIYPPQVTQAAYQLQPACKPYPVRLQDGVDTFRNQLDQIELTRLESLNFPEQKRDLIASFRNVSQRYLTVERSDKTILNQINLDFYEGERIALVGGNGAGKSTLLKLITGLMKPSEGKVYMLGTDTCKATPEQLAEQVAFIYQQPEEMFIMDNIRSDIAFFRKARNFVHYNDDVDQLLEDFRLKEIQEYDGRLLSGGQQRRASLAIGMGMCPELLLLDEPTASLDVASRKQVVHMLTHIGSKVKTVVIATHDMQLAADWASRIIVLQQGEVLADTTAQAVFTDPILMSKAGLLPPQIVSLSTAIGMHPPALSVDEFCDRQRLLREEWNDDQQDVG